MGCFWFWSRFHLWSLIFSLINNFLLIFLIVSNDNDFSLCYFCLGNSFVMCLFDNFLLLASMWLFMMHLFLRLRFHFRSLSFSF